MELEVRGSEEIAFLPNCCSKVTNAKAVGAGQVYLRLSLLGRACAENLHC